MQAKEAVVIREPRGINIRKLAILAGVLIAVFLVGYIPPCVEARRAREQNSRFEEQLRLAELCSRLAMAGCEANRNHYASAALRSAEFFNGVRAIIDNTKDERLNQKMREVIAHRDEITFHLAAADPVIKEKLAGIYADLFEFLYPDAEMRSRLSAWPAVATLPKH